MNGVLVVDDEPQLLRALRITLTAGGYDVYTAATGRRALAEATARLATAARASGSPLRQVGDRAPLVAYPTIGRSSGSR